MIHTTQKPSAILRLAKARIDTPEKWGQGGDRTQECALDALQSVCAVESPEYYRTRLFVATSTGVWCISAFNDTHTHAEVMEAFDRAIALAEAEEGGR